LNTNPVQKQPVKIILREVKTFIM